IPCPDFFPPSAPIFPLQVLVNSQLAAADGQGIARDQVVLSNVFTTQGVTEELDALAAVVGGNEAAVIAGLCANLPSQCAGEDLTPDPNNLAALNVTQTSSITTADRVPGSPGHADLYTGALTIPYYLTAATNPSDTAPVADPAPITQRIRARYPFYPGDTQRFWTRYNVLPISTGQESIPVLISVPNGASGQTKPGPGWPTVIFQHGITRNRLDMLALADAYADAGILMVAIDLPLHGYADISDSVLFAGYEGTQSGARERTFGLDLVGPQGQPGPDGVVDASGTHYLNLSNLLVAQGNLAQSVSDLMHLMALLPSLDYDGGGTDVDASRVHFVGHSLGGMMGIPFLRQAGANIQSATLAMAGGGIAKLLDGSQSFGPILEGGLAAAGVLKGTPDYEAFLWGAQTIIDRTDPLLYAQAVGASGLPIHFIEVVGGGTGGGLPDATIPNSVDFAPLAGSNPLISTLGLATIVSDTVDGLGIQGAVRFIEGAHQSLISPIPSAAAFAEMTAESIEFVLTSGTALTLQDESVIDTNP
ncbi:MAG TPA: hypothetical protein PLJ12_11350, partial [Planctomycetota bacterium]|nr:hypothetical protein [Planctomycetota bacterium]